MKSLNKAKKSVQFDKIDWTQFFGPIVGVDEVGRGCLAGPVMAGACILRDSSLDLELTDSKLLSESRRESLSSLIQSHHQVGIGVASVEEIDEINILKASLLAMKRAVLSLGVKSGTVLIDGKFKIPDLEGFEQFTFIKGDLRVAPISAASICAKVERDQLMKRLAIEYPNYELEKHKGYSTLLHKKNIEKYGASQIHRKTFSGVKEFIK